MRRRARVLPLLLRVVVRAGMLRLLGRRRGAVRVFYDAGRLRWSSERRRRRECTRVNGRCAMDRDVRCRTPLRLLRRRLLLGRRSSGRGAVRDAWHGHEVHAPGRVVAALCVVLRPELHIRVRVLTLRVEDIAAVCLG